VQTKDKRVLKYGLFSRKYEPIAYPILFTQGEDGFDDENRCNVQLMQYLAARVLQPEQDVSDDRDNDYLGYWKNITTPLGIFHTFIPSNRFQIFGHVFPSSTILQQFPKLVPIPKLNLIAASDCLNLLQTHTLKPSVVS